MPAYKFPIQARIREALEKRKQQHSFRSLYSESSLTDFCSNDYLGFARSESLRESISLKLIQHPSSGSTGSRLLRGNTAYCELLEKKIAEYHQAESGLIFNSGYDANLGLFSTIGSREDIILYDSLIHASVRDGIRLSQATAFNFRHNDLPHLEERLKSRKHTGQIFVAVESVYSMDGDVAPLAMIAELCETYNACLIVDEAHATGVIGATGAGMVCALNLSNKVFARVHTFGKALGCHGAIVLGNAELRDYLINFSRPFIYTTALPPISLCAIDAAYELLTSATGWTEALDRNVTLFNECMKGSGLQHLPNKTPIQCVLIPGNDRVRKAALSLVQAGLDVRPILAPTVASGAERIRICIHLFNTEKEITVLADSLIKLRIT
ncbi:MAG: aminotransferase class I/II-fold pyridoxal phosphate-dependent enzyme [Bacteroidia bacterium]